MQSPEFSEVVDRICAENGRFHPNAYLFVRQGLDFTLSRLRERGEIQVRQHISGEKLLEGIRAYALEQYGPMAKAVLDHWNIETCRDFGTIVFELVDYGVLGKTDEDSIRDFEKGYDFSEAFEKPFLPRSEPS
ncbi:MAG: Minf_1886 family protein [Puniceicoccales bacterium]